MDKIILGRKALIERLSDGEISEVICGGKIIWKNGDPIPTDAELDILVNRTRN